MTKTTNRYSHPVAPDTVTATVEETTSDSHDGVYKGSVDFAVPLGTTVYAAAGEYVTTATSMAKRQYSART